MALVRRGEAINHPIPTGSIEATPSNSISAPGTPELVDLVLDLEDQRSGGESMSSSAVSSTSGDSVESVRQGPAAKKSRMSSSSLPGTGGDIGSSGGGVGGGSSGPGAFIVPPSRHYAGKQTRKYCKSWKFLTEGYSHQLISKISGASTTAVNHFYLTTPLANIPVDKSYLYMSHTEHDNLRPGERATHCEVKVYQRNVRVAFPTASSESSLATLNQNKNIMMSVGLNKTGYGFNTKYTVAATTPMKPTDVKSLVQADDSAFDAILYGSGTARTVLGPVTTPGTLTAAGANVHGYFVSLPAYFTGHVKDAGFAVGTATGLYQIPSFPPLKEYWRELDAADLVGAKIIDYKHTFKFAPLRTENPYFDVGDPGLGISPNTLSEGFGDFSSGKQLHIAGSNTGSHNQLGAVTEVITNRTPSQTNATINRYTPMERSQHLTRGISGERGASVQPSIHVGVQAVPALTAGASDTFVNVQAYFDVECCLYTEYDEDALFQRGSYTVGLDDVIMTGTQVIDYGGSLTNGLYTAAPPTV